MACFQDFSKSLECENLTFSATAGTKTALDIIQLWFNYFAGSVSRHLEYTFPGRVKREMPL